MTTPPSLPVLPGLSWSRHKKPAFSTRVATHVSGREVRAALMTYPLYEFETVYSGLSSAASPVAAQAGLGASSLQSLMGFFLQLQGQFGTFLYTDPDDDAVTNQSIATGDGATQSFVMLRTLGGFAEPVDWVTSIANVCFNGVAQSSSNYLLMSPNSLCFYTAPAAGTIITASFSYAFQCRFLDDQMDFEEFMSSLWRLGSMKFRSVKSNTTPVAWYLIYAIGGVNPTLFADTSTEGSSNNYLYGGTAYPSFAVLLSALGITFTRSSPAYYTNSSGVLTSAASGVLRFDYVWNGAAWNPQGLLLEGASTNILTNSQELASGSWTHTGTTVTADTVNAPDGTKTAGKLCEDSSNGPHYIVEFIGSFVTGNVMTLSVFAKAAERAALAVYASDGVQFRSANFNLTTGIATAGPGAPTSYLIQALPNGWYRCIVTVTFVANTTGAFVVGIDNPLGTENYTGTTGYGLYLWGVQCEALPFASSYIPTTSSSVTRAADSLSAATWPAIATGTLYAEADTFGPSLLQRILEINDGTSNNKAALSFNASAAGEFDLVDGGTSEAALTAGAITARTTAQLAAAFQANDFAFVVGGGTPATASSGAIPSFSKLYLGAGASGNPLFGHLTRFGVWNNQRGPNSTLQELT